jgi:hypothetical protein
MRFLLSLLIATAAVAHAELSWDKPTQQFDRSPEDEAVEARYSFRNTGAQPVTIKSLRSSCGCTTARLEKKTYAPGEQGEVTLRFKFGDRKGLYRKTVTVNTDEQNAEPLVLNLIVNIHDPLTFTPALVWWRRGDASEAKTVQAESAPGQRVAITGVSSSSPAFSARLVTTQAGQKYAVVITPASTTEKTTAEIKVQTNFPADAPRAYTIHARVK